MADLTSRYSIEITSKDVPKFHSESADLLSDSEVAITSLPSEDLEHRIEAAQAIRKAGLAPVPHLAARRIHSSEELVHLVGRFTQQAAVDRFFLIAGDVERSAGPFSDSLSLIKSGVFAEYPIKRLGIAGYPEGHPKIPQDKLWNAIIAKIDAVQAHRIECEIVTQFSFDAEAILFWLQRLRNAGVFTPVKIGIPGPASMRSLLRFASVCGVDASAKVIAKYGFSLASLLRQAGPDTLIASLEDNLDPAIHGEVSLHFYPFGGMAKTIGWASDFRRKRRHLNPAKVTP
jgi:methylenetetrahydrofolate reductase (NADPH)